MLVTACAPLICNSPTLNNTPKKTQQREPMIRKTIRVLFDGANIFMKFVATYVVFCRVFFAASPQPLKPGESELQKQVKKPPS